MLSLLLFAVLLQPIVMRSTDDGEPLIAATADSLDRFVVALLLVLISMLSLLLLLLLSCVQIVSQAATTNVNIMSKALNRHCYGLLKCF